MAVGLHRFRAMLFALESSHGIVILEDMSKKLFTEAIRYVIVDVLALDSIELFMQLFCRHSYLTMHRKGEPCNHSKEIDRSHVPRVHMDTKPRNRFERQIYSLREISLTLGSGSVRCLIHRITRRVLVLMNRTLEHLILIPDETTGHLDDFHQRQKTNADPQTRLTADVR